MTERNAAFDGIRGYAVILVFLVHFCGSYPNASGRAIEHFDALNGWAGNALLYAHRSHYGVDIFFVLSGYFIARILQSPEVSLPEFLRNRFLRIYPAFLLSLVVALVFWHWVVRQPVAWEVVVKNLFFLNGILMLRIPAINGVTWSLFYEVSFYLGMALLVWLCGRGVIWQAPRMLLIGILPPLVLIIVFSGHRGAMSFGLYWHLFLGAALAGRFRGETLGQVLGALPATLVVFAWLAFTTLFSLDLINYRDWYYYPISGFATLLLVAKIGFSEGWLQRCFSWKPLASLGRISYSFYLLHSIVIPTIILTVAPVTSFPLWLATAFLVSVLAAFASYRLMERPYFNWSQRLAGRATDAAGETAQQAATRD